MPASSSAASSTVGDDSAPPAAATATTASVPQLPQPQATMTKEELALEDRRRRNRETQRAIRKRKAQKLQDSEVKIVMHEQELERMRGLLEDAQTENAALRKQLATCVCRISGDRRRSVMLEDDKVATRERSGSPSAGADETMMHTGRASSSNKKRKSPTDALASVFSSRPTAISSPAFAASSHTGSPALQPYPHPHADATTYTSLASLPLRDLTHAGSSPHHAAISSGHGYEHSAHLPAYVRHSAHLPAALAHPQYSPAVLPHTYSHHPLSAAAASAHRYRDQLVERDYRNDCPPGCQCGASFRSVAPAPAPEYEATSSMSTSDGSRDDYFPTRVHRLSSHRSTDSSNSGLTLPPLIGRPVAGRAITRNGKGKSVSQPTTDAEINDMRLPLPIPSYSRYAGADAAYSQTGDAVYASPGTSTRESSIAAQDMDAKMSTVEEQGKSDVITPKASLPETIAEQPLVESPRGQSETGEATDDTVTAEEEQTYTSKPERRRSTLDDFKAVFGEAPVEVPAA